MPTYRIEPPVVDDETAGLRAALAARGWNETRGGSFDMLWSERIPARTTYEGRFRGQRINHFPGIAAMYRKDELHRHLSFARRRARAQGRGGDYAFVPESYLLPEHRRQWLRAAAADPDAVWVLKPRDWGFTDGIDLVTHPDAVDPADDRVAQRYLDRPMLLGDHPHKAVLRVYVLVTSLVPLVAHVYRDGIVRFACRPYSPDAAVAADPLVHLTNPPIQQEHPEFAGPQPASSVSHHLERLGAQGVDPARVWSGVRDSLARTVIACREPLLSLSRTWTDDLGGCFELLGCDVLLDADGLPFVCEANDSPSLGVHGVPGTDERAAAEQVKAPLVRDLVGLLVGDHAPDDAVGGWQPVFPGPDAVRYVDDFVITRAEDLALIG